MWWFISLAGCATTSSVSTGRVHQGGSAEVAVSGGWHSGPLIRNKLGDHRTWPVGLFSGAGDVLVSPMFGIGPIGLGGHFRTNLVGTFGGGVELRAQLWGWDPEDAFAGLELWRVETRSA